jgi:uncharacterized membrane protein HdeD (DUF308 family)
VPGLPIGKPARPGLVRRTLFGGALLILGGLALAAPLVAGKTTPYTLGLLLLVAGGLQTWHAFAVRDREAGNAALFGGGVSIVAGLLLAAQTQLVFTALVFLLGLSWIIDGVVKAATAIHNRHEIDPLWGVADGAVNALLGIAIAFQRPIAGIWSLGIAVGLRTLASGWSVLLDQDATAVSEGPPPDGHPDERLGLAPHAELARMRAAVVAEDAARQQTDRYWRTMFILTFFAIHVGRMDADWDLVGLLSPGVAVLGDLMFALLLAYGVALPIGVGWRAITRPVERRAWRRYLARVDGGRSAGLLYPVRGWLTHRLRFAVRTSEARGSPTAALGWGLQVGLPLAAILIALNPIWGFSWYFNTENWATEAWARWAERRTDDWREAMIRSVRAEYPGVADAELFRVTPDGVADEDFSFLVIGDPGEGDPSQHVLRDQFLALGRRPDVKFLVVSSDVIYPSGDITHYEPKFYLPFKGFDKPVYAVPGNHDWYDALDAFTANFLEPRAARAALRGRREEDHNLTTTTEGRIDDLLRAAARLRDAYGVRAALQRAPYFEVQADRFALIVADTGILKTVDPDQLRWLGDALDRARGKFKLVILGHPLYAGGHYQGTDDEPFAAIHRLLREHQVEVVMGGDTHDLEFYREPYTAGSESRSMLHVVNGGGGAYLSIGTALAWPTQPPVADCGHYPRADALTAKMDEQTPSWKRPLWFWVKRFGAWPSSPEAVASAFDFNTAPFFQSFFEVRVERSTGVVRLLPYGTNGRLRWRDLQVFGQVIPEGQSGDEPVEFRISLPAR